MPKFLNIHSLDNCSEDQLKKSKQLPADEFGVTHVDIFYNTELGLCFCIIDAPNRGVLKDTMRNMALNVTGSQKLIRLARHRNSHGMARLCVWILYSRISHYNNPKYERKNLLCNLK